MSTRHAHRNRVVFTVVEYNPAPSGCRPSPLMPPWGHFPVFAALAFVWLQGIVFSQTAARGKARPTTGKEIFLATCAGCHGPDGKGMPRATLGFEPPKTFPDFTDCNSTTREPDEDWKAIIHYGGPARGFSEIMPSFTDLLTGEEIEKVVEHLRSFCGGRAWPRGELNLPRALITEKAFPEDEAVVQTNIATKGGYGASNLLVYERRFGLGNQFEVDVPFEYSHEPGHAWLGGIGDVTLGYKRLVAGSVHSGSIFSVSGEATLPTGNRARGFGSGSTVFEAFGAFGQMLPRHSFVQFQSGVEVPVRNDVAKAVFARTALGTTLTQGHLGRLWTPMIEFVADRDLATGEKTNWDVVPEIQVTLSRRQHIRANFGVSIPASNTATRSPRVMFYLLWDWFDGGLREGWR